MVYLDRVVFEWINGLAGRVAFVDTAFRGLANDYFMIIGFCLILMALWFGTRDYVRRRVNQTGVIVAAITIGLSAAAVNILNAFYFRPRPFTLLPTQLLFYAPTDSSFPSNAATVVFAMAFGIFMVNRRLGLWLIGLAFLEGFARIFVGIHYPLDVLGGAAISGLIAWGVAAVVRNRARLVDRLLDLLEQLRLA